MPGRAWAAISSMLLGIGEFTGFEKCIGQVEVGQCIILSALTAFLPDCAAEAAQGRVSHPDVVHDFNIVGLEFQCLFPPSDG